MNWRIRNVEKDHVIVDNMWASCKVSVQEDTKTEQRVEALQKIEEATKLEEDYHEKI